MRTIDWDGGAVRIIDQTRLPEEMVVLEVREVDELVAHIRSLAVRGAPALGVAGALGMALAACRSAEQGGELDADLAVAAGKLSGARPTAVNLSWGVEQLRAARAAGAGPDELVAAALAIRDADISANRALSERGAQLLAGARRVLTHCNAGGLACVEVGTALGVIERLHEAQPLEMVYVCETRPLLQGSRLTAWELGRRGIPHRVIVDSAAAGLVLGGQVEAVVVGADRIAANGDVANKVGTVAHAVAANYAGIPFVVAAPESTIDPATETGAAISIELRDDTEVLALAGRRVAAPGSTGLNPAFDVTPAALVTAIVTERRTISGRAAGTGPGRAPGMAAAEEAGLNALD
ncbi:S-methyl-5-thioribose-1-phosphate isomerase [Jatrophihabitans sp.]|uniref:S-methyl-5-thioribose-1-phosphate isomerase n=1 Tax=Jatrophihabitans sp. TaxID=1932789 RepID=UPI002BCE5548|nr:S-methyl-5-thioribose-1-phosphate isomerase [Jatrophihabitans sp.]